MHEIKYFKRCKPFLGTYVDLTICADEPDEVLLDMSEQAFQEIGRIEQIFSFYRSDSELSMLNQDASDYPCIISSEMQDVLETALILSKESSGFFDITIAPHMERHGLLPKTNAARKVDHTASWEDIILENGKVYFAKNLTIDLGGIAKGYAVDKAFTLLNDYVVDLTINAGGDLRTKLWQGNTVNVKAVDDNGHKSIHNIVMQNSALASSASYYTEHAHHSIISPAQRSPIQDDRHISVFAPSCLLADALTKIAFLSPNPNAIFNKHHADLVVFKPANTILH